ncbi:MAG: UDP-N-acetylmuramate--L-alanine ligase [Chlorobi bacterium]|nr:UDP-N-acetylmuramate--L-alanine ligase [Chlorobiota bacterium]
MSALARYYNARGANVSGYDKTPSDLTARLQKEGIAIHFEDDVNQIPDNLDLIIYTPAVPKDLKEFVHLQNSGIGFLKRSEALGLLTKGRKTIAVAGTHGKTTVSTLIAWLLNQSELGCTAFLGGISNNFKSNLVYSENADWMVAEADEYDKSFLKLFPDIALVTSVDADHLDIYGSKNSLVQSFNDFISQTKDSGTIIIKQGLELEIDQKGKNKILRYSLREKADYFTKDLELKNGFYTFDLQTPQGLLKGFTLGIPGLFNVENAVAALSVALMLGIDEDNLRQSLARFSGTNRRFDILVNDGTKVYIDDYAHHPKEIEAVLHSVREMFPRKKLLGVFQPHLYSRTRDFAKEFGKSLSTLDELILLPIYPAREKPISGVDSELIAKQVENISVNICEKNELIAELKKKDFDVLITMGAGDIDRLVEPIVGLLKDDILSAVGT